jgi:hypothetical protein
VINKSIKTVRLPEFKHLISKSGGGTYNQIIGVFYHTRLLKYVHKLHYRKINNLYYKVTADWKLKELCERGYLLSPKENVYCATDKVLPILNKAGYNINNLPPTPKGIGGINELNNTEAFINLLKEKHFHTLLYPNFGYLRPDALLVELDEETKRYRLSFIEVEAEKPDWKNYILEKERNYLKLSGDIQFYEEWCRYCEKLMLPKPNINIKFNYRIIKNV